MSSRSVQMNKKTFFMMAVFTPENSILKRQISKNEDQSLIVLAILELEKFIIPIYKKGLEPNWEENRLSFLESTYRDGKIKDYSVLLKPELLQRPVRKYNEG